MNIALIKNGKVENIIVADIAFAEKLGYEKVIDVTTKKVSIGWVYNTDGTFSYPDTLISEAELLVKKTAEEKKWRDSELLKTDELAKLPDFPKSVELLQYRQELRDYPASLDFPNGVRPIKLY